MTDTRALTGLPHNVGAQFRAKFDSNCKGCDRAVYEGDLMGYVDDVAVCDGCYNDADQVNHESTREMIEAQREADRAADPEKFERREAAAKKWTDAVKAKAAEHPGKEWVPAPNGIVGYAKVPPPEPTQEDTITTETVEPGIAALMAAGLLSGQEPGGSGVCDATITDASGKVTEVAIPVPVLDLPGSDRLEENRAKGRAPRKSRAKPKPEVPSTDTVGDPGVEAVIMATPGPDLPSVASRALEAEARHATAAPVMNDNAYAWRGESRLFGPLTQNDVALVPNPNDARLAQLAANAADWDPATIAADVKASQLQTGLQAAVNSGAMTCEQAEALGWVDPVLKMILAHPSQQVPSPSAGLVLGALSGAATEAEEDAILEALDSLPAYVGGFNHDTAKKEILGILQEAIDFHPRSLQKSIGPSEIGTECDHCLAAKLAGWEQVRGDAWLPTVGTAVHSWIESAFGRIPAGPSGSRRFLTERRVSVGEIDGEEITGSTDLCDVVLGCTWDWKIVGATTLKSAKTGPSRRYVVQQMLYGRGWNRLGVKVTRVGIAYLPRNAMSLNAGVWWSADYDEEIAVTALERASTFARNIKALASIGPEAVDAYVSGLPRWREWREDGINTLFEGNRTEAQGGKIACLDCPRYADYPADPAKALAQLDGLLT